MKIRSILSIALVSIALIFASCVKEGPAGIAGQDGLNGTNGLDGSDGADGTAVCAVCHENSQFIYAKEQQYAQSGHATLPDFERNEGECAICHTSQGFIGNLDGSYDWTADGAMIENPNPQNCYTCHNIHQTYTIADFNLTVAEDQEISLNNTELTHSFGASNVCVSCHQTRPLDLSGDEGGNVNVNSPYWGFHHGPQGAILGGVGMGLYEVGTGLYNHQHSKNNPDGCITCHMGDAYGTQAGGHTLKMTYDYHGHERMVDSGCKTTDCHDASVDMMAKFEDFEGEIDVLMATLNTKLNAAGILNGNSIVPGTYPILVAGALADYNAIDQDGSHGAHNPSYVEKLLENLISELGKLGY